MSVKPEYLFFSIVIPAHNEGKYIEETLQNVKDLNYPQDLFETIVVENASSDDTLQKAKRFESVNLAVYSSEKKGVSAAKNLGVEKRSAKCDWVIFLDADTVLKKDFLAELNSFLLKNKEKKYSVGTTEVKPLGSGAVARAWFLFYDFGHRVTKTSYSIQIVKNSAITNIRFDENISMGEDIEVIRSAEKYGYFFFFKTKNVFTSTRRFDREGWWKTLFSWTFVALLPSSLKRRFRYKVVR